MALFREERLKHLRILGLKYDATEDDVKKTYKKLALKYHPDKCQNDPDATKRFQELSAAYYGLKKLYERERKCACSCGYAHFEEDSDCSDFYDSDEEDEDLLDFFRRIFMDVFSEFVFRKKFQSKKRRKDYHPDEEDEEECFFEFLSKKFRSEGQSTTDDYVLTEEDLKKFPSYDEWQKARDPSKPHNRCKRKAVQKSRRYQKGEQKAPSRKQLKAEQQRKEKELKDIREELLKNLEEQKQREHQKKKKAKNSKPDTTRSKTNSSQGVRLSPERMEIESQLQKARQRERELEENLRRLEAQENKKEKKLRKQEKKKAKKQQGDLQTRLTEQLKKEDYYQSRYSPDLTYSRYEQDHLAGGTGLHKGFSQPVSKQDRDKGLQELMNRVKMKKSHDEGGGGEADTYTGGGVEQPTKDQSKPVRERHTSQSQSTYESEKLQEHLRAYHELMKLQPKRHTEQQLREERGRIRDAQFHNQQQELLQLRRDSANTGSHDDHTLRMTMREEFLQRQRERELQRNQEELRELSRETAYRKNSSAPAAPLSRKHYESISYQEKHAQFQRMEPVRSEGRKKTAPIPVVDNPIKREIQNPESMWSRVVKSTTPWGERSRRQMELGTLLPQSTDEEERMLQEALAISVATAQQEERQRVLYEEIQQADIDRRVKEAASRSRAHGSYNSVNHGLVEQQRPPISKYPLSDKYQFYPGIDGSQELPAKDEPTWSRPTNRSDKTMICRPHGKKETWSLCPGEPSADDWSFTPSHRSMDTRQDQQHCLEVEEEEEDDDDSEEELDVHQQGGEKWKDAHLPDFDYKQKNTNWSAVPSGAVGHQQVAGHNRGFQQEIIQPKPLGLNFNLPSQDKRPVLQSTSTWDEECAWKLEGPSYPRQSPKQNGLHLNEKAIDGFGLPVEVETLQESYQSSHEINGNNHPSIESRSKVKSPQLTSEKHDEPIIVEMREMQTNTDPPEVVPTQPETHDCFTQTKVSTGFVGGYWDSVSNNEEKIPVPEKPAPVQIPDPAILELIPERGCAPADVPQGPKPSHNGQYLNDHKSTQDRIKKAKAENWDENLITSFTDLHMDKPPVNERVENSIAVNTNRDNTTLPRMPVPQDKDQPSGRRMMTDDQKLSDQNRAGTGPTDFNLRGTSAVLDFGRTANDLNHKGFPFTESRGHPHASNEETMSNGMDQGTSGTMIPEGPSISGVEPRGPSGTGDTFVNGIPEGLPPHLIQAYMDFVSNNNAAQPGQQTAPVQNSNSPKGIQSDNEISSSESSLPNPGQPVGPRSPSSMSGFGQPGFLPPMWPPMIPLMMASPMMAQPMVPYCHPLYAYSLQQKQQQQQLSQQQQPQIPQQQQQQPQIPQMEQQQLSKQQQQIPQHQQQQLPPQQQQYINRPNETNGQALHNLQKDSSDPLNVSLGKDTHQPRNQLATYQPQNPTPPQSFSVNGNNVPCKLEQLMVGSKHSPSGNSDSNQTVPGANHVHLQHGRADIGTLEATGRTDSEDWEADYKSTSMNGDSSLNGSQPKQQQQQQQYINRGFIRPSLPPRFQRQKRLELKKKIQTFIREIKKEDDDFTQTEIVNEENRVST